MLVCACGESEPKTLSQETRIAKKDAHYVKGVLRVDEKRVETDEIVFNDLQSVVIAHCVNEIADVSYLGSEGQYSCKKVDYESPTAMQNANYLTCSQLLYSCVGYKFLELAELEGQTVLEGWGVWFSDMLVPFASDNHFDSYLRYGNGIDYRYKYSSGGGDLCLEKRCMFHMTLGPQEGFIRTWLYQAARDAFERAGISGARILHNGVLRGEVIDDTSDGSGTHSTLSLAQRFVVEYFDVLERYLETVSKLARHQLAEGARQSQWTNSAKAQSILWNDPENSRLAALKTLLNDNSVDPQQVPAWGQIPVCNRCSQDSGVREAVEFLRAGRAPELFESSATPLEISRMTLKWLNWDREGSSLEVPDDATTLSFLRHLGFGLPEVHQAVEFLREEQAAFFRVYRTEEPVAGHLRLVSLMPPSEKLPSSFWQGRLMGRETSDAQSEGIWNRNWFRTKSLVHPHRSAHELVQYMRDGALLALTSGQFSDTSEVKKLYGKLLVLGTRTAGDRRLILSRVGVHVRVVLQGRFSGAANGIMVRVVRDRLHADEPEHTGFWCYQDKQVGQVPCDDQDYVVSGYNASDSGDGLSGSPFEDGLWVLVPSTGILHVFEENGTARPRHLFSFDASLVSADPVMFPVGGTLLDEVSDLMGRDPEECSLPLMHCTGLPVDLVPPLENELTSDSDGYETSWRHYLNLAMAAANEADQLGQQLVDEGLQMDMRAEEAARALEEICGNVVNVGDIAGGDGDLLGASGSSDPSLSHCLPDAEDVIPMVSIGPQLCLWKIGENDWCVCPSGSNCPRNCPIVKSPNGECGDDLIVPVSENIQYEIITESLELMDALRGEPVTTSDMTDIEMVRHLRQEYLTHEKLSETQWATLSKLSWFDPRFFSNMVSTVSMNPDPFYHYKVMRGNGLLWSTHKAQNKNGNFYSCPTRFPWRPAGDDNPEIFCEHCAPTAYGTTFRCDGEEESDWVANEFCMGGKSAVIERILWGSRINDILKTASLLGGHPSGFAYPRRGDRGSDKKSKLFNANDYTGLQYYTIPVAGPSDYVLDPDGRTCIRYFDGYAIPDSFGEEFTCNVPAKLRGFLEYQRDFTHWYDYGSTNRLLAKNNLVEANWALGGSLGIFASRTNNWFDDTVRHDGNSYSYAVYQKLQSLWSEESSGLTLRKILVDGVTRGSGNEADVRDITCVGDGRLGTLAISTKNGGDTQNVAMCLDADRLWDALEFAAFFATHTEPGCLDVENMSEEMDIQSTDDLGKVAKYVECASKEVMEKIQRTVFYNVPKKVVEKRGKGGNGQYAGVQGELLQAYLDIENALTEFTGAMNSIPEITFQISQQIRSTKLEIELVQIQGQIANLRSHQALMQNMIQMMSQMQAATRVENAGTVGLNIASIGLLHVINGIEMQIKGLQQRAVNTDIDIRINNLVTALGVSISQLRSALDTLTIKGNQLNQAMERLQRLRNRAEVLAARATLAESDSAGRVYPTNTVMRRRYNTHRIRYEKALTRAKKLAFIARRAIEFRLGENLARMTRDMTLVDAPSSWVEDLCTVTGMDYSQIRDKDSEQTEYSGQFIGDYVRKLADLVESYSFDHPFHESEDVAVISVRDDIKSSVGTCLVESYNQLVHSGNLGYGEDREDGTWFGWEPLQDCWTEGGHPEEVCTVIRKDPGTYESLDMDPLSVGPEDWQPEMISGAMILSDGTEYHDEDLDEWLPRATGVYGGGIRQTTPVLSSGRWMLSFWVRPLELGVPGRVVVTGGGMVVADEALNGSFGVWRKVYVPFELVQSGVVQVTIWPSFSSEPVTVGSPGKLGLWGLQLERGAWSGTLMPQNCPSSSSSDCTTSAYQATDGSRLVWANGCVDTTGSSFRQQFRRGCTCVTSHPCTEQSSDRRCYRELDFVLNLNDIESGRYLTSDAIARGNYNYRHGSVALNLVGSNLVSCSDGGSYQCHANGYLPYTLIHDGRVLLRNHTGRMESFSMNHARVEHGKALAAEVVVTNPPTGHHQTLLSGFEKREFRGRPLMGQYTLRLWETDPLNWEQLEDVQLVWRYRYWTAFW